MADLGFDLSEWKDVKLPPWLQKNKAPSNPDQLFMQTMLAAGFKNIPPVFPSNGFTRMDDPTDRAGKKSGFYIFKTFIRDSDGAEIGWGYFGSNKSRDLDQSWTSISESSLSDCDFESYKAQKEDARVKAEVLRKEANDKAADECNALWVKCKDADVSKSEYLKKKSLSPVGNVRYWDEKSCLLVPIFNENEEIVSLERVWRDDKKHWSGGKKQGCFFRIDGSFDRVYVCEGYATGASVFLATGATVYVAFDCGNLYHVTGIALRKHPQSRVIIAADDDFMKERNAGRIAAEQCASGHGVDVVYPAGHNDFDDWRMADFDGLKAFFAKPEPKEEAKEETSQNAMPCVPDGFLKEVYSYYMATTGLPIKEFAVQTGLAMASVLLGRVFCTRGGHSSMLYFLNVAETSSGKEHGKSVINAIAEGISRPDLVSGDGFSSDSAIVSMLSHKPRVLTIIDEFTKYLEGSQRKGDSIAATATRKLLEVFSSPFGVMRPKELSRLRSTEDQNKALDKIYCYHPHITLFTMTTPEKIFSTIGQDGIDDGFLNRFIVCVPKARRVVRKYKEMMEVTDGIVNWYNAIEARKNGAIETNNKPSPIWLSIHHKALETQEAFQQEMIDLSEELRQYNMHNITHRCAEISQRIALIVALCENPNATVIEDKHQVWAQDWVRFCLNTLIQSLHDNLSGSDVEAKKKAAFRAIKAKGADGISFADMNNTKTKPFSEFSRTELKNILEALVDADMVYIKEGVRKGAGRPSKVYVAVGS